MGGRGAGLPGKGRITWWNKSPLFEDARDAALWEARMVAQNRIPLRLKIVAGELGIGVLCWIYGWLTGNDPTDTETKDDIKQRVEQYLVETPTDHNVETYYQEHMQ